MAKDIGPIRAIIFGGLFLFVIFLEFVYEIIEETVINPIKKWCSNETNKQ